MVLGGGLGELSQGRVKLRAKGLHPHLGHGIFDFSGTQALAASSAANCSPQLVDL